MKKEVGHQLLKRLGKKRLRPGGKAGTAFLQRNIIFFDGMQLLEVACNRGINLIEMAKQHPESIFIGVDVDREAIAEATREVERCGIKNCSFIVGSATNLDFENATFDYVMNEAMLTMFTDEAKRHVVREYYRVLKPGGFLLTHDIMILHRSDSVKAELSAAIHVTVSPLEKEKWDEVFRSSGFKIEDFQQGELSLMSLKGMLFDEGFINTCRIIKNGLKKENRAQFLKMRKIMLKLNDDIRYICYINQK